VTVDKRDKALSLCGFQSAIEEARSHDYLNQLFCSLPVPPALRSIQTDMYQDNEIHFIVGQELVMVKPTSGVRQGDGLSSVIFNLAMEPLV
jgi:hypothetical protein